MIFPYHINIINQTYFRTAMITNKLLASMTRMLMRYIMYIYIQIYISTYTLDVDEIFYIYIHIYYTMAAAERDRWHEEELKGMWSQWLFSVWLSSKRNCIWFIIKRKTVIKIIFLSICVKIIRNLFLWGRWIYCSGICL